MASIAAVSHPHVSFARLRLYLVPQRRQQEERCSFKLRISLHRQKCRRLPKLHGGQNSSKAGAPTRTTTPRTTLSAIPPTRWRRRLPQFHYFPSHPTTNPRTFHFPTP